MQCKIKNGLISHMAMMLMPLRLREIVFGLGQPGVLLGLNRITGAITFYNRSNSGLPSNYVQSITIDKRGNKWIGTSKGLAKFDGGEGLFKFV